MSDEPFREKLRQTLLGRLRLELFRRIDESEGMPTAAEQRHFMLGEYRKNPAMASCYQALLTLQGVHHVEQDKETIPEDVAALLVRLEEQPLESQHFVEIHDAEAASRPTGILVSRDRLEPSGFVYELTFFSDDALLERVGRMEVRACMEKPRPPFSVLGHNGFERFGAEDVDTHHMLYLATLALSVLTKRTGVQLVELDRLVSDPRLEGPADEVCEELIAGAYLGEVACAKAHVPLDRVRPYSREFCVTFPIEIIRNAADRIRTQPEDSAQLVVYWDETSFVMSDDYSLYLAYRRLGYEDVPVVIMGKIPDFVTPSEVGGAELFPPLPVTPEVTRDGPLDDSDMERLIDEHVKGAETSLSPAISSLYALHFTLARMISLPNTSESAIHEFFRNYPMLVDPTGYGMQSEVRLGDQYRADLLIQFRDVDRQILLIELERANIEIFTKSGRPRAEVTHATQQVEDWLRWWQENPDLRPSGLDQTVIPKGAVVVGRSKNMDADTRQRLTHLNANRNVSVITYDDLLIRIEDLIRQLENLDGLR